MFWVVLVAGSGCAGLSAQVATFVYDAAMSDAMVPRKLMPHPELEENDDKPFEDLCSH
jgi:hypothetical protein